MTDRIVCVVELSKMDKLSSDLLDFKELWCYFLKKSGSLTREDPECLSRHEELEEAMSHFDKLSQDERMRNMALDQHMAEVIHDLDRSSWIEQGREEGIQRGRTEGREEGRTDLILKMLEKGCSVFEISQMTDLSTAEILDLKNKKSL